MLLLPTKQEPEHMLQLPGHKPPAKPEEGAAGSHVVTDAAPKKPFPLLVLSILIRTILLSCPAGGGHGEETRDRQGDGAPVCRQFLEDTGTIRRRGRRGDGSPASLSFIFRRYRDAVWGTLFNRVFW